VMIWAVSVMAEGRVGKCHHSKDWRIDANLPAVPGRMAI